MSRPVKIACKNVWLLFGKGAKSFLKKHNNQPTSTQILKAGLIGAVRNVSLDVHEGEILMIMGLSGSGKSTLIRCMTRLVESTGGEISFDGKDLLTLPKNQLLELRRHNMGMVFQHFGLLPHRTVLENIAFPLEIQNIDSDTRIAKARELVKVVGLEGRENYFPRELSGGQQQRVGIARSLADEPDIWFLDEPFSALDPLIRREMQDEFLRLQSLLNKTIVFVTHDFDEAVRLGDRIAIMKDGELIQIGTPEELVLNPATEYVEQFVRHAPKAKLITVQRIMQDDTKETVLVDSSAKPLAATDTLEQAATRIINSDKALSVIDNNGEIIGSVSKQNLLSAMFN
jgi:glycine betaine/proline transport system ATP-binding protein